MELFSLTIQFLLMLLGVFLSTHSDWCVRNRNLVIGSFVFLFLVGASVTKRQGRESERRITELTSVAMTRLNEVEKSTASALRLQTENQALQQKLLEQGKNLTDLATRSIDASVGGNSFARVLFESSASRQMVTPWAVSSGTNPIYDLNVRVVNVRVYSAAMAKQVPGNRELISAGTVNVSIGNMPPNSARLVVGSIPIDTEPSQRFNVSFSARNGFWNQTVLLERVDNKWLAATRIFRQGTEPPKMIHESIDTGFPRRANGSVDWDHHGVEKEP